MVNKSAIRATASSASSLHSSQPATSAPVWLDICTEPATRRVYQQEGASARYRDVTSSAMRTPHHRRSRPALSVPGRPWPSPSATSICYAAP